MRMKTFQTNEGTKEPTNEQNEHFRKFCWGVIKEGWVKKSSLNSTIRCRRCYLIRSNPCEEEAHIGTIAPVAVFYVCKKTTACIVEISRSIDTSWKTSILIKGSRQALVGQIWTKPAASIHQWFISWSYGYMCWGRPWRFFTNQHQSTWDVGGGVCRRHFSLSFAKRFRWAISKFRWAISKSLSEIAQRNHSAKLSQKCRRVSY